MKHWNSYERKELESHLSEKASLLYGKDVRVRITRGGASEKFSQENFSNGHHVKLVRVSGWDDIDAVAEELATELNATVVTIEECEPRRYAYEYGREIYQHYVDRLIAAALTAGDHEKTHCKSASDWQLRAGYLGVYDAPEDIKELFSGRRD
jgi:hypothetical protein